MVSMILRPYIHNPCINDIKGPIFTTHMVSMILRPYIHNPYVSMILRPYIHNPYGINDIKALYSQPIWYQ